MKFKDFIKDVKSQISSISKDHLITDSSDGKEKPRYRYYAFVLLACGIEMLGGALDDYCWHCPGLSKKRFNKALKNYESLKKYERFDLYSLWRCGVAHTLTPNRGIGLCVKSENSNHLDLKDQVLIIVLEEIVKDFEDACCELIENIEENKNSLSLGRKVHIENLFVPQDSIV